MKLLKLVLYKIREKLFIHIILSIQVFMAMFMLMYLITEIQYINRTINITRDLVEAQPMYVYNKGGFNEKFAKTLPNYKEMGGIQSVHFRNVDAEKTFRITMLDDLLLSYFKVPLLKGVWPWEYTGDKGYQPVVVSHETEMFLKFGKKYTIDIEGRKNTIKKANIVVCGVLRYTELVPSFYSSGNQMHLSDFFRKEHLAIISGRLIDDQGKKISGNAHFGQVVFTDQKRPSKEIVEEWRGQIKNKANISSLEEMEQFERRMLDRATKDKLFNVLLLIFIVIAGIGGNNILMAQAGLREFGIYYMCGAKWRTCIAINSLTAVFILVIPFIVSYISVATATNMYNNIVDHSTILFSAIVLFAVYILSSSISFIKLYITQPVDIIRRNQE